MVSLGYACHFGLGRYVAVSEIGEGVSNGLHPHPAPLPSRERESEVDSVHA